MAPIGRNIVVCCDGTSNEFTRDLTNVAKLTYALIKDPDRQLLFYHPGLGTRSAPGFAMPVGQLFARLAGLAFGYGIKDDIADAYIYIMNHWRPGDRLFLFGFSRGAYTVRAIAALLHMYGLAMPGNEALVPYAVRMLWRARKERAIQQGFAEAGRFKDSLSTPCRPHFVGVWDTVSSVGWVGSPVALPYTKHNPDIARFRHAVSIDEHRAFFRTNLFEASPDQDVFQLWFPGDHCDVGGGHPEAASGLSKYPLEWIAREAITAGLLVDEPRLLQLLGVPPGQFAAPSPTAPLHQQIPWYWWPAEFAPKQHWDRERRRIDTRFNLFRRRNLGPAPLIHGVAWNIPGYAERLPADAIRYPS